MKDKLWFFLSLRDQKTGILQAGFPVEDPTQEFEFATILTNGTYKVTYQLSQNNKLSHFVEIGRKHRLEELTVIGEAAARLSAEFCEGHPGIPWRDIVGFRNIAVHRYQDLDIDVLHAIVRHQLSDLEAFAAEMVHALA